MIWILTAAALVLWLTGTLMSLGTWVNLFLVAAVVLLVYQVVTEREPRSGG